MATSQFELVFTEFNSLHNLSLKRQYPKLIASYAGYIEMCPNSKLGPALFFLTTGNTVQKQLVFRTANWSYISKASCFF